MINMVALVRNEVMKIWKKKRFFVVLLILLVLIPIFTYAQLKVAKNLKEQFGTEDWRVTTEQKVKDYSNRIGSPRLPKEWRESLQVEIQRLQYHLDHNIDPDTPNGVTFTREFVANSMSLFLPLMVLVVASDLVSSEHAMGTIKLLVTRPVRRWQVLASKYLALMLYTSLIVLATGIMSYLISGLVFGYHGWTVPVLTGFEVQGAIVNMESVRLLDQWQFLLMEFGLAWFSSLIVGIIALLVSVLIRSTAAGMGVMVATLIAGSILTSMASSWETAKYFFMVNLQTVVYLTGGIPPIPGMTMPFSLMVLSAWAVLSIIASFFVFTRKDILL